MYGPKRRFTCRISDVDRQIQPLKFTITIIHEVDNVRTFCQSIGLRVAQLTSMQSGCCAAGWAGRIGS